MVNPWILFCVNKGWQDDWVPDKGTRRVLEAGDVATDLSGFVQQSLPRFKRWVCGLTLTHAAVHLNVSLAIFEVRDS